MKTTRLILALAAALSLGLAVFANVRSNLANSSTQSITKVSDDLVDSPSGAAVSVTGIKIADDLGCLTSQPVTGVKIADDLGCLTSQPVTGIKIADDLGCLTSQPVTGVKIADDLGCLTSQPVTGIKIADDLGCLTSQASGAIAA
jgi:biotin operon repressor